MNPGERKIQTMVETLVRAFVDRPEDVVVSLAQRPDAGVLELTVAPSDMGKVIGRQGRTARALRTLVSLAAEKLNCRFHLQILD
jgi:predicted RNA-binding protein YlqC (UPF0109 family)